MSNAYLGNNLAVVKTRLGTKIFVSTLDHQIAPHLLLDGEWEAWMTRAMHPYLTNVVFFDVGANYGWYSLVAHNARARKIVAFEPNSAVFDLLDKTMCLNGIRCSLYGCGLSDQEEQLMLNASVTAPGTSSFLHVGGPVAHEECLLRTLDSVADEVFEQEPELQRYPVTLKIDVEGLEARVVMGGQKLLQRRAPAVTAFVEHHQDPRDLHRFKEMLDFFEQERFVLNLVRHDEVIEKINRSDLSSIPDAEMLCFRRFSA